MESRAPDFEQIRILIRTAQTLDADFGRIFEEERAQEQEIRALCAVSVREQAVGELARIPVEELRSARAGIRTSALLQAGYQNLLDLHRAPDWKLQQTEGIGDRQISAIRTLLDGFIQKLSDHIRLRPDPDTEEGRRLITAAARCLRAEQIRREGEPLREDFHDYIGGVTEAIAIRGRLRWLFSRRRTKEDSLYAVGELTAFCRGQEYTKVRRLVDQYAEAQSIPAEEAVSDFRRNNAAYYALLEKLTGTSLSQKVIYSSIPAQLAAQIDALTLDLRDFRGNLRAYQTFGTKYILAQKRVLLGDEMGLGKTIQAIAAMAHLQAAEPGCHFLIVCPASVMINWCREILRFSSIEAHLLHGPGLEEAFREWQERGGAAITNYESMGKLTGRIDSAMRLAMLVIDEAHYIKNPEAQRTRNIHALEDESERILLMTGTPLENRVNEMCELVGFVRPDMVGEIRANAGIRHADAFREILAPVYLRRRREEVLEELPPLTEENEWCTMTPQDLAAYSLQVAEESLPGMRRVAFLQDDLHTSSKACRLLELCREAAEEGRKIIIYSYFRETIRKIREWLREEIRDLNAGGPYCAEITGSTPAEDRQTIVDRYSHAPDGSLLLCQVQAGGTGLNIQAASVVIFCEPQIKPSLTRQAIARVFRMGQSQKVLVFHLLCDNTVDESVMQILQDKQAEFDLYADESVMSHAADDLPDREWIRQVIERERTKYLPAVIE